MSRNSVLFLLICLGIGFSGCQSYDGEKARQEHVESFSRDLAERTNRVLSYGSILDLNSCIKYTLEHSYAARSADLQQRIAKLNKQVSFANFLPAVRLNAQHTWFDPNPAISFNGSAISMQDKHFRDVTWNIELALFNPATWNLYAMHKRGYEVAAIVNQHTRQAIALQVTSLYFQILSLEKVIEAAETQLSAAEVMVRELEAMHQEGLIAAWQTDQGQMIVLSRKTELHQYQRSLHQVRAELLGTMGLSPQSELQIQWDLPLTLPAGTLEDVLAQALLQHPSLAIADRQVAIDHEKVKLAIASFLPQVMGFAQRLDTNDSHQVFSNYWLAGLSGTMTIFNGFANINQYKAAKLQRQDAFIQREQSTMTLMIQVIRAWNQVQVAKEQIALARMAEHVADQRLRELRQQHRQGLVQTSDLLALIAENYQSRTQHLLAQVQYQTSIAMLLNVMGQTQIDFEESTNDAS